MKIRLNTLYAGPLGCIQPGTVVEIDAETAEPLVAGGFAVRVDVEAAPAVETADAPKAAEVAEVSTPRGRKK